MLSATAPMAVTPGPGSDLAPLGPDRALVSLEGGRPPTALVPVGPREATPALEATSSRAGDDFDPRFASPREIAERSLEFYAEGLLEWEDHTTLAFQPELHPDYDRTVGALLGTKAQPDRPRDFIAEWEQRLVFELRYNPESDEAVARARRIVRALRRTAGAETDVSA
ncbi:MAG: hypothetical protein AAB223_09535 [Pseudomonadota bacterium]